MKTLKVWGTSYGDRRRLVAAFTQKQAIELSGESYQRFKNYYIQTGNDNELSTANEPGVWEAQVSGSFGFTKKEVTV